MKLKAMIHNVIFVRIYQLFRSLSSTTRLHYNWCSSAPSSLSHVLPLPSSVAHGKAEDMRRYYESTTWTPSFSVSRDDNDDVCACDCDVADKQEAEELASYLQWLEEKGNGNPEGEEDVNEIDRLADLFIASCHEKFRLEKIESYRKYQEMLSRGI
ncbi:hypothetical protein Droror1_Dr00009309 [Drosera rotundifolia]